MLAIHSRVLGWRACALRENAVCGSCLYEYGILTFTAICTIVPLWFLLFLFVDNFQGDYQPNRASVHLPMVIWDFVILTRSFHTLLGKKIHYLISTCFSNPF